MEETKTPRLFELLGGRKMTLTWVAMLLGTAIEIGTERGISETFAMFLAGAVASFSAANVINTIKTSTGASSEVQAIGTQQLANATESALVKLDTKIEESKAETKKELEAGAAAVQGLASTIENMKKILTALATGKKVS